MYQHNLEASTSRVAAWTFAMERKNIEFKEKLIKNFRKELLSRISSKSFDEDQSAIKKDADFWKAKFFEKYPEADSNKDGQLSWQEHKKYKAKLESAKK